MKIKRISKRVRRWWKINENSLVKRYPVTNDMNNILVFWKFFIYKCIFQVCQDKYRMVRVSLFFYTFYRVSKFNGKTYKYMWKLDTPLIKLFRSDAYFCRDGKQIICEQNETFSETFFLLIQAVK